MFGLSGENLTKRLRSKGFKAMLSQDIAWFDDPSNNVGALCTRLSVEAAAVQGATGSRIGYVLMSLGNLGVGILIAFINGWALTLVILGFIPFLIAAGMLQTKMMTGFSLKDKEILEEAGKVSKISYRIGDISWPFNR
jgi:ATP-binding cassette subfamily B (MDR/TAP) protein 1